MLPSSTQALILALRLRGPALPHDRKIAKQKWHKEGGRMEATATTTHRREYFFFLFFFFRSGGEDKRIGCSQDKGGRFSP